jgi:hypothetical protein
VGLPLKAIEVEGTIDEQRRLQLDEPLPIVGPSRVRVIILIPDETDFDEKEWLQAAATNPAFDFLKEPAEDIYTLADGKPLDGPLTVRPDVQVLAHGPRRWLHFRCDEITAAKLIAAISARYRIRDLTIKAPEIEAIVRRIYEEGL